MYYSQILISETEFRRLMEQFKDVLVLGKHKNSLKFTKLLPFNLEKMDVSLKNYDGDRFLLAIDLKEIRQEKTDSEETILRLVKNRLYAICLAYKIQDVVFENIAATIKPTFNEEPEVIKV